MKQVIKKCVSGVMGITISRKVGVTFENRSYRVFGCKITGRGKNNTITFKNNSYLKNCNFTILGSNNRIELADNVVLTNVEFYIEGDNNLIQIGFGTTMAGTHRGVVHLAAMEGEKIIIGEDCMFSDDISIRTSDSHPIIDKDGVRINSPKSVWLGDHVWVGTGVLILKGSRIPRYCIIGARSLVTKEYTDENCLITGVPARIIKTGVAWKRER